MSTKKIRVLVKDGSGQAKEYWLQLGADGDAPLVVDAGALQHGRVLLSEDSGGAPDEVVVRRGGDDLLVSFDGASSPQLTIQDFYRGENLLGGLGEDGAYYPYVGSSTLESSSVNDLTPETEAPQALSAWPLDAHSMSPVLLAGLGVAGALGVASVGLLTGVVGGGHGGGDDGGGNGSGNSGATPARISSVTDSVGPVTGAVANGGVTDDSRVVIAGMAAPGSVVTIFNGVTAIGSATTDSSGNWQFRPATALPDGTYVLSVSAAGGAMSASFVIQVDTTAPPGPLITGVLDAVGVQTGNVVSGGTTDDNRPTLSGTGRAGDIIRVYEGMVVLGTAVVGAGGTWSLRPATPLADATHSLTAIAVAPTGVEGPLSSAYAFTVDTSVPVKPVITSAIDSSGNVTGPITPGTVTDEERPVINGTAGAGTVVTVFDNGVAIGTALTSVGGVWQFTPAVPLLQGLHAITAVANNAAGNASVASNPFGFTVDTGAPLAPAITDVIDDVGSIIGTIIKGNGVTDDARPDIKGSAQAGAIVSVYDGATLLGTAVADATGAWSFTPGLPGLVGGVHSISATATNAAGNISPATGPYSFTVDLSTPAAPTVTVTDQVGAVTGTVTAGSTIDDPNPLISGTALANAQVDIYDNGVKIGSTHSDGSGAWSFTPGTPLTDSGHAISAKAINAAGTASGAGATVNFTVDTSVVEIAITRITDAVAPILGAIIEGGQTNDRRPVISGLGTVGGTVNVYDGAVLLGSTTVAADRTWSFTPPTNLAEGAHSLTAKIVVSGVTSSPTRTFDFTVDVTASGAPVISSVSDDVGAIKGPLANGAATDDTTPTLAGRGVAGEQVSIYDNGVLLGQATVAANGLWTFTTAVRPAGLHSFTATQTDAAGNVSPSSAAFAITIDISAPATPVITSVVDDIQAPAVALSPGAVTKDATPTVNGTAEPNSTLLIYDGDAVIGTVAVNGSGNWTFTPSVPLVNGDYNLTSVAVDAAGNRSQASINFNFHINAGATTVAPAITHVTDNAGAVQGLVLQGGFTDDLTPTINGTARAGSTVSIYDGATLLGTVVTDASGNWSLTAALAAGAHAITAQVSAAQGVVSTGAYNFTIDLGVPAAPSLSVTDNVGAVTGTVSQGSTMDDPNPQISGSALANARIDIYDNGVNIGTTFSDSGGAWSFTPATPLLDGGHAISAQVISAAGTPGALATTINFTVDTSAVVIAITRVTDAVAPVLGVVSEGGFTNDPRPAISGIGTVGATVNVYDGASLLGTTTVAANGTWSFTPSVDLIEGVHNLKAEAVVGGVTSAPTPTFQFTVDITPPPAPSINSATDDVGSIKGPLANGASTDDTTPTLNGQGAPGSQIAIRDNGSLIGIVTVRPDGSWSLTPGSPLTEGTHTLIAQATDAAGNVGPLSPSFTLIIDTTAPVRPAITSVVDDLDSPAVNLVSGAVTADATPTVNGTAAANATVVIYNNGAAIGSTTANGAGVWTFTPPVPLINGDYTLVAVAQDGVGNASNSDGFSFKLDAGAKTVAPAITHVSDNVGAVQGLVVQGGVTDDATPTINGTAEAGRTISVYDGATLLGSVVVDASGNWSLTTPLAAGAHSMTAQVTTALGTLSSGAYAFTIDLSTPATPTLAVTDNVGAVTGPVTSGMTIDDSRPQLSGTAQANTRVDVYDNGVRIGTTQSDAGGLWSFIPSAPLPDGAHGITAQAVNAAGASGAASTAVNFVINTLVVTVSIMQVTDDVAPVTGAVSPGGFTNDQRPAISGQATGGATVNVYDGATLLGSTTAASNGSWQFTPGADLVEGAHSITAGAVVGGVTSPRTSAFSFTVDITAPAVPVISSVTDDVGAIQGALANGAITDDTTPTINGTGVAGQQIVIRDNGNVIGITTVRADGTWTLTPGSPLVNGAHAITAQAVDAAGNVSPSTSPFNLTLSTTAPAAVALLTAMSKDSGANDTDFATNNGSAGRGLVGTLSVPLGSGEQLRVSTDGGATWQVAAVNGTRWTAVDPNAHGASWQVQMQVINGVGTTNTATQAVTLDTIAPGTPVSLARSGDVVTVGFAGSGAVAGDTLHLAVGNYTIDQVLSAADITAGTVSITIPAALAPSVPQGAVLAASMVDQVGNSSAYRTLGAGFQDFNTPVFLRLDGTAVPGDIGTGEGSVFIGGLNISSKGRFYADAVGSSSGTALRTDGATLRVGAMAGDMSQVSFDLLVSTSSPPGGALVTYFNAQGGVISSSVYAPNVAVQNISYTAPAGQAVSYFTVTNPNSGSVAAFHVDNIDYTVNGVSTLVDFTSPTFRYSNGTTTSGAIIDLNPVYLNGMEIYSNNTMYQYGRSGAANNTTENFLALSGSSATTFIPDGHSLQVVSLDVANAGAGGTVVFYNASGAVIGSSGALAAAAGYGSTSEVATHVTFSAPAGESVAYFIVNASSGGAHVDNISYFDHTGTYVTPTPLEHSVMPGADAYFGGPINETFSLSDTSYFSGAKAGVHGGGGIDTLKLTGNNQTLDLTGLTGFSDAWKISSIEKIDLTGNASNKLKISLNDVLNLGGRDLFVTDGKVQFMVNGDSTDTVELSKMHGNGADPGAWAQAPGTVTVGGVVYNVYEHSVTHAELLVQQGVATTLI